MYDHGISIVYTLSDTQYRLDKNHLKLSTTGTEFISSIDIDSDGMIFNGLCTCSTAGSCQHLAATLYQFLKDHASFASSTPHAYQLIQQASIVNSDSDSSKKRSLMNKILKIVVKQRNINLLHAPSQQQVKVQ
jgi:uncharacterized Zn finger protein